MTRNEKRGPEAAHSKEPMVVCPVQSERVSGGNSRFPR
jgi:hypothetical protein